MKEMTNYLKMVYRRRYLFLGVAFLVTTVLIAGSYFLPKKYRADSTVFIEKNVINDLVKGIAVTPDMEDRIRVLKYALLSRDIVSKVLADLDVDVQAKSPRELQDLISDLQKRTEISVRGKELFIVSITDPDPAFAQDYINRLVSRYVEENISGKRQETYGANRFLDEQIVHFKGKLDEAEDAIIRFRREQGVFPDVSEESLLREIAEYRKEIEGISLIIETQQAKAKQLRGQLQAIDPTVAIFSEKQKEDRLARVEERIRHLLLNYTEMYPEVLRLRIEAEELQRRLDNQENVPGSGDTMEMTTVNPLHQDIRQKILESEAEISALEGKRNRLQQLLGERERELQNIPEHKKIYSVLVQERDSLRKIHEQLLMRLGQSEVSKQMEIGDKSTTFRIVDPAIFPAQPVFPNMVKMILLALAAGLGAGAGLVVLLEGMNSSVLQVQQLRNLGLEVIAVIPSIADEVGAVRQKRRDLLACCVAFIYFTGVFGLLALEAMKRVS